MVASIQFFCFYLLRGDLCSSVYWSVGWLVGRSKKDSSVAPTGPLVLFPASVLSQYDVMVV